MLRPVSSSEPMGDGSRWTSAQRFADDVGGNIMDGIGPVDSAALWRLIEEAKQIQQQAETSPSPPLAPAEPSPAPAEHSPSVVAPHIHRQPSPEEEAISEATGRGLDNQSGVFSHEGSHFDFDPRDMFGFSSGTALPDFSSFLASPNPNASGSPEAAAPPAAPPVDLYDPVSILPRIAFSSDELKVGDAIDLEKEFEAFAIAEQTALRSSTRHSGSKGDEATGDDDGPHHPMYAARRSALQMAYEYPVPLPAADAAAARRRGLLKRTDPVRVHQVEELLENAHRNSVAEISMRQAYAKVVLSAFTEEERACHEALQRKLKQQTAKVERLRAAVESLPTDERRFQSNKDALTSLQTRTELASHSREHVETMDVAWSSFMIDLERRKGKLDTRHLDAYFCK